MFKGIRDALDRMHHIRIAIVDDHAPFRKVLRQIIEREHDLSVVAETDNGLDATGMMERFRPDVVVMDLNMPVVDGFDAIGLITEEYPATKVITLSIHTLDDVRERAMEAGAYCFHSKDCIPEEIVAAIRDGHQSR